MTLPGHGWSARTCSAARVTVRSRPRARRTAWCTSGRCRGAEGDDAVVLDIDTPEALDLLRTARPARPDRRFHPCAGWSRLKRGARSLVPPILLAQPASNTLHAERCHGGTHSHFRWNGRHLKCYRVALRSKGEAVHLVAREQGRLADLAGRIGATYSVADVEDGASIAKAVEDRRRWEAVCSRASVMPWVPSR